jgi:ferredoxin
VVFRADRCSGIGLCEAATPDIFEIGDDGRAHVRQPMVDSARRAELEEAAMNCPTASFTIEIVN